MDNAAIPAHQDRADQHELGADAVRALIDHAILKPELTRATSMRSSTRPRRTGSFSVCVRPSDVAHAVERLQGTGVGVGTVIGFPHGTRPPPRRSPSRCRPWPTAPSSSTWCRTSAQRAPVTGTGSSRTSVRSSTPPGHRGEGHPRDRVPDRRRDRRRIASGPARRRGLREDVDRVRRRRRDGRAHPPDAGHRGSRHGCQGIRRRPRPRHAARDGPRGCRPHRHERLGTHPRRGRTPASTGTASALGDDTSSY